MVKRKVIQYTKDMVPIRTWNSIKEAQDAYHISHISGVCRRQRRTDGGFVWRYEDPAPLRAEERRKRAAEAAKRRRGKGVPQREDRPGNMSDLAEKLSRER